MAVLAVETLSREGFAAFGDVIAVEGSRHYTINDGHAERHHDLARVDVAAEGGRRKGTTTSITRRMTHSLT